VVPESHQGGEETKDDRGVDEVYLLPYGIGDSIGAGGRGGGTLGEGESDFFLGEGRSRGVFCQAASSGEGVLRGKEVVEECIVDCDRVSGIGEGGEPGGLSWSDQLFGCPDVVQGGLCEEVGRVGCSGSLNGIEIAGLGLSCRGVGVRGWQRFGSAGSFRVFLSEGSEEGGPPSFGPRGGA